MNDVAPASAREMPQDAAGFSLRQRFVIWLTTWVGTLAIRLFAPTLRWTVSIEEGGPAEGNIRPAIYVFWHRCVFAATWHFRRRQIAVMTSRSFDGEYIARIIEKFGYSAVRGSSSRGAVRALLGMHRVIEDGRTVAFTIDGPRGPRYVAKPGPVLLARNTQVPVMCFHIALENPWILPSWDSFMIPKPFSRALVRIGRLLHVPRDADAAALERYHAEMQATLDRIRAFAEENVSSLAPRR
ncbi:MAG: lysophospholipid acyltransferase family protein [Terriglobales bacterium]